MSNTTVSEEALWSIEDAYEKSFQQILNRDGVTNAFRSRENAEMETPCVEIKLLPGKITEEYRHAFPDAARKPAYAAWKGSQLIFTIKTNRQNNATEHKTLIAKVRKNCQMYNLLRTWPTTEGANANAIADIREDGCQHSVDSDNDLDITTMTFWLMHNLKNTAWPLDI